ncbi:MAG TPA: lipid-A-disaccharide synthase [Candidatus Binatus sp.]|nr:lipid-A-disaccharide synthase [Candidatus Binatus sp.]
MNGGGAPRAYAPHRVLLVAGEASGDLHGADLVRALRARVPDLEVFGLGGERLREVGMETVADARDVATVGVTEAAGRLRALWRAYRALARRLREDAPDLCVLVDFPEFNLRLAHLAKRAGVPVLYYIGPQVWAWRRGRVRKIARRVDRLAVVFPFEPALYAGRFPAVEFVGHPLLDRVRVTRGREETLRAHGLDPSRRTVLLLPGSRSTEIDYLLPRLLAAVRLLAPDGHQFPLALAHTLPGDEIRERVRAAGVDVTVIEGDTYNLIAAADVALVSSGTATLECALLECPMVIVYRLGALTYGLGRLLVRGVRYIGMPNIIAGREVVPELLQRRASGPEIAAAARAILDDPARHAATVEGLRDVRRRLGRGGAAGRAAAIALEMLEARP